MNILKHTALTLLLVALTAPSAHAARLYFYPQAIDVVEGETFVLEVRVDTQGELINALEIEGKVTSGVIESVDTANSLVEIFIESSLTDDNTFKFSGGTPGGFTGDGIIGRLTIKPEATGGVNISFGDSLNLLTGTGNNVEAPITTLEANAVVEEKTDRHIDITSRSHPNQNTWYNKGDLQLHWDLEDRTEYSYLVSLDSTAIPDNNSNKPTGQLMWLGDVTIEGLTNGIYYFTLKRVGESEISRYRAQIDTTPPSWIAIEVNEGVPETRRQAFATFLARDELSGISRYEVTIDDNPPETVLAPYILPIHYSRIVITAYDKAGNTVSHTIIGETGKKEISIYVVVALIVIGSAVVAIRPIRERIFTQRS